jgi:hypothetical protein
MVRSVEGIYCNGRVEVVEPLAEAEGSRVIVTWAHPAESVDLREPGIEASQAADLRRRLPDTMFPVFVDSTTAGCAGNQRQMGMDLFYMGHGFETAGRSHSHWVCCKR